MRRALLPWLAAAALLQGCGSSFELPTENRGNRLIPGDQSYQMLATWTGQDSIQDILLTQGTGTQLFLLYRRAGVGMAPRGEVRSVPLTRPDPIAGISFPTLFNPVALASGGGKVFVLDQGDTCLARANPANGSCETADGWGLKVTNLSAYWRVREFGLLGGDTLSTFTDTTVAYVRGVAADAQGRVYVSGTAIINVVISTPPLILERTSQYRIYRYVRGPRYAGVDPADRNMPGANWHRDTTWVVEEGSGVGTVVDPRGLFWSDAGSPALYVADFGKNWVQKLSDQLRSTGFYFLDGGLSGLPLNGPTEVTVDRQGFVYITDPGNRRVLRYSSAPDYVQRVDVELDAQGQPLGDPVAVAADDSLVYVADRALAKVIRYQRRK